MQQYQIRSTHQVYDPEGVWFDKFKMNAVPKLIVIDQNERLIYALPNHAGMSVIESVSRCCAASAINESIQVTFLAELLEISPK